MYTKSLIDRARNLCDSDADLARRLEVSPVTVHKLRNGQLKLSPELAALLAEMTHDDPAYACTQAMIENAAPNLASRLTRAFHRVAIAGAVATLLVGVRNDSSLTNLSVIPHDYLSVNTIYIVALLRHWFRMRVFRAFPFGTALYGFATKPQASSPIRVTIPNASPHRPSARDLCAIVAPVASLVGLTACGTPTARRSLLNR